MTNDERMEFVGRIAFIAGLRALGGQNNMTVVEYLERDGERIDLLERRASQAEAERDALDSSHKAIGKQLAEMGNKFAAATARAETAEQERDHFKSALLKILSEAESDDGMTAWDGGDIARAALSAAPKDGGAGCYAVADQAMQRVWSEWFSFYERHFRGENIRISMADQQAFYEIAQPILRKLSAR